jgi:hypothetical protein
MKNRFYVVFLAVVAIFATGCTQIETGEVGLRKTFNGTIEEQELGTGWHQTLVGSVIVFAAKEILLSEENLTPQSKDKSTLKDFDMTFTYTVDPKEVSYFYTKYSYTAHLTQEKHKEIFPMGVFVTAIVRAAAYSAVAEFDALEVNNNRTKIEQRIVEIANKKLEHEKLQRKADIVMVNVKNIQLADIVVESANRAVNAQNDLVTKTTEVLIATQEGLRIKALAQQSGPGYIQLLYAQSNQTRAEALLTAAKNKSTIWVVPQNFTALGGIGSIAGRSANE